MFAPDILTGRALRSSRRRQRTSSDESVKPPKAKRQRSVLGENAFSAPESTVDSDQRESRRLSKPVAGTEASDGEVSEATQKHLPVRGPKKTEKSDASDRAIVLVCIRGLHMLFLNTNDHH